MNSKQRVLVSISHKTPDKVPYHVTFTQKAWQAMVDYSGGTGFARELNNCLAIMDTAPANAWCEIVPDIWEDEFGVQWDRSVDKDIGVVCNCLVTAENFRQFQFPDPDNPSRYTLLADAVSSQADKFILADIGFSLFERAWTLAGMETILMGMAADPEFVHALLERITQHNLRIIDRACQYPIDGMRFGDDWGQQSGLIMGPDYWREFIKPCLRQMYRRVKEHGKKIVIHSCGKVNEIFPDLIEIGLDVFNPFQPEAMDVFAMKKLYGAQLSFYGGISTQRTLPFGTPQQTRDEVRRLLDEVGANGGYIAAPAHDIPGDARPENIVAMITTLNQQ